MSNFIIVNWLAIAIAISSGIIAMVLLKKIASNSSYARMMFFTHLGFVTIVGWGLVVASATFNGIYTYGLLVGMPGYEKLALIGSVFAVAVNLAGGIMLQASAKSFSNGRKLKGFGYALGYLPIVAYSLLAANSVLLTGDANTRHKSEVATAKQEGMKLKIEAYRSDINSLAATGNSAALADVPTYMQNSNGIKVRVSSLCKVGNWYAKNQPACQQYLAAKNSNANASVVSANRHEIAGLQDDIATSLSSTVIPLQSSFFGYSVPPSIATLALALAIELAAIGCLVYVVLDIGLPPALPVKRARSKSEKKQADSRSEEYFERSDKPSGSRRSGGSVSDGAGNGDVNNGLDNDSKDDEKEADRVNPGYYQGGSIAAKKIFNSTNVSKVTLDQFNGFLFEIAKANPHKPAVANQVIAELRYQVGCGIGKPAALKAIQDSHEFILTEDRGGSNSYIFKAVNDEIDKHDMVQTDEAEQGLGSRRRANS